MFDVFYSGTRPNLFAHERSANSIEHAQQLSKTRYFWWVNYLTDYTGWDFLWEPVPWESQYTHTWPSQWQSYSGTYLVPKHAEQLEYKFHTTVLPNRSIQHNYKILIEGDLQFDWTWSPHPMDPPYIYVFGNQWHAAEIMPTVEYHVAGATERKYMDYPKATLLPSLTNWKTLTAVDWDYSWRPDPGEPPYVYVFGNQHYPGTIMPTVEYHVAGAKEQKFVNDISAQLLPTRDHWEMLEPMDEHAWDWTWRPDPTEPPYVYVFGNQWNAPEFKASIRYTVPGATDIKYMDRRTCRLPQPELFRYNLAVAQFDYSWEPNPFDPPMTYVFGNQWNSAVLEPTVIYTTGGTEIKYVDDVIATLAQDCTAWELLDDIESFDYSWRPNPTDPPYIYVFGNQWLTPEQRPALRYIVSGATEIKYMSEPRARRVGNPDLFVQLYPCEFDWSWEPDPGSPPYIYVFGNQYYSAEVMPTVEYHMSGATERKFMDIPAKLRPDTTGPWQVIHDSDWDYTWQPEPGSPPYIYVFGNQWWPAEKMPTVEYHMLGATEHKYMPGPVANLPVNMSSWHIPTGVDVRDMDFSWVPDPGEPAYIYQFATQHQKTGGPQYRVPGATDVKYLDMMRAEVTREAVAIFEIDHLDGNAGQIDNTVRRVRYFDNYRDTLIRLANNLKGEHEHVWICSSICDYTNFDFSWHPETWQSTMLHVFPSDGEKFGDTFYMHVPTFAERAEKKELLEWYSVNYVTRRNVPRRLLPVITHTHDTHVEAVKTIAWNGPLAVFSTNDLKVEKVPPVPLWREKTKTIVPLGTGASQVVVPRSAIPYIKTQLYDYPHIDRTHRQMYWEAPLDIVFIDNGEPNADYNYLQLPHVSIPNRIHRSSGVNGRVAAYHAAARLSRTPWFFAVFAKLIVDEKFDWAWQPDRMQEPKHYIFHAHNPVTGLTYGHQAMIAYNRELVLNNLGLGLDFTLDSAHEVVPIVSGTARYTASPWMAWRTAFRECIKLRASLPDVENEYRLNQWLNNHSAVKNGEWSIYGAQDAVEYYDSVNGDLTELRKSYDWAWLATYAMIKRGLVPDQ